MKNWFSLSAESSAVQWLIFFGLLLLVTVCFAGFIVWMKTAKNSKRKRKKHRHRRQINPTLAQTGGLPPRRDPNTPPPGP